jgi:Ran GTPase-activating protein (RanGAP) involved in mRNA processing and transport
VVELDISGKALTPEGFFEIAPTLVKSIDYEGEHGKVVRLEELSLSDSKLDASCLRLLGQIVASASDHLRDFDLSKNHIKITTDTEAAAWELFLSSFSNCRGLRKIDFSGNHLGPRAFEIMTRVYSRETLLDVALLSESIVRRRDGERLGILTRKLSLVSSTDGHANVIPPQPRTVSGDEVFGHGL